MALRIAAGRATSFSHCWGPPLVVVVFLFLWSCSSSWRGQRHFCGLLFTVLLLSQLLAGMSSSSSWAVGSFLVQAHPSSHLQTRGVGWATAAVFLCCHCL